MIEPHWNKAGTISFGRDPLGLQAASVRLFTQLVPGLTNVTNRLRYYSFYCWVIGEYEKRVHSTNLKQWRLFIRRAEAAYVMASNYVEGSSAAGMAGKLWSDKHVHKIQSSPFDMKPWTDKPGKNGQYLKAVAGNFGQFYIASMVEIGCLSIDRETFIPILLDDGKKLANAFADACPNAVKELTSVIESGLLDETNCSLIGSEAHPARIVEGSEEHKYLNDFLSGKNSVDLNSESRKSSLWNLFYVIENGNLDDFSEIRAAFYTHMLPGGKNLPVSDNLNLWRAFEVNEYGHLILELFLNQIVLSINQSSKARTVDFLIDEFLARAFPQSQTSSQTLTEFTDDITLGSLTDDVGDITAIALALKNSSEICDATVIKTSVELLVKLWKRWRADVTVCQSLAPKLHNGRSVVAVFDYFDKYAEDPVLNGLRRIIGHFVFTNHLIVAAEKLATGRFTYRISLEDGLVVDGIPAEYGFSNPRLGNLYRFAEDAGLIENSRLTGLGKAFLSNDKPV